MADISVTGGDGNTYRVTVTEGTTSTTHDVTVPPDDIARFGASGAEELVEASFRFLLEREPKESILRRFDLSVIGRYFPEYADRIGSYMS